MEQELRVYIYREYHNVTVVIAENEEEADKMKAVPEIKVENYDYEYDNAKDKMRSIPIEKTSIMLWHANE